MTHRHPVTIPWRTTLLLLCLAALTGCVPPGSGRPAVSPASPQPSPTNPHGEDHGGLIVRLVADLASPVPIGESVEMTASVRAGGAPTWQSEAVVTPEKSGSVGAFQQYSVRLKPQQPGGVKVVVEVDGKQAEAMLACVDPSTMSRPIERPEGFPRQALHLSVGTRLIQSAADWAAFLDELRAGQPDLQAIAAPVDLATRTMVAVIHDPYLGTGPLVVTHVEPGSPGVVSLVEPRVIDFGMNPYPGGYPDNAISLLEVGKVSPGASIEFVRLSDYTHETRTLRGPRPAVPSR